MNNAPTQVSDLEVRLNGVPLTLTSEQETEIRHLLKTPSEITIAQAARMLGLSRAAVLERVVLGDLPSRIEDRRVLLPMEAVQAYRERSFAETRQAMVEMAELCQAATTDEGENPLIRRT